MNQALLSHGPLSYLDQGVGPVLLLVHGFPLDHTLWREQMEPLSRSLRLIVPDLRGFGHSPLPTPPPEQWAMADHARDLVELLDHLKIQEPVAVCGLSMGGYITLALWKHWPQRVGRLLLVHTRAIADSEEVRRTRQQQAAVVLASGIGMIVEGILPRLLHPETLAQRPELVAFLRQMMNRSSQAGVAAALRGMAARPDMTPELRNIRVPTLVLVGEADAISRPDEMRSIAQAIPGSQFVQIADAGHLSPLEQPAAFNAAVVEFLGN